MKLIMFGSEALDIIHTIITEAPQPNVQTEVARKCGEEIGLHLIMLIMCASDANLKGRHSCALTLFRSMEDALDCFAAVTLVPNAAERWLKNKLKASDAAKLCEPIFPDIFLPSGERATDYRKELRSFFNSFAHCSQDLTKWNAYPEFLLDDEGKLDSNLTAEIKFNHEQRILEQNAIRIGAYLAAHTLEFIEVLEKAYEKYLFQKHDLNKKLLDSKKAIEDWIKQNLGAVYLKYIPPELEEPIVPHPSDPKSKIQFQVSEDEKDNGSNSH